MAQDNRNGQGHTQVIKGAPKTEAMPMPKAEAVLVRITRCRLIAASNPNIRRYVNDEGFRGDFELSDGRIICFFGTENDEYFRTSPGSLAQPDGFGRQTFNTGNSAYAFDELRPIEMTPFAKEWFIGMVSLASDTLKQLITTPRAEG